MMSFKNPSVPRLTPEMLIANRAKVSSLVRSPFDISSRADCTTQRSMEVINP